MQRQKHTVKKAYDPTLFVVHISALLPRELNTPEYTSWIMAYSHSYLFRNVASFFFFVRGKEDRDLSFFFSCRRDFEYISRWEKVFSSMKFLWHIYRSDVERI